MRLVIEGHDFAYEMENLCRLFYPLEKIETSSEPGGEALEARTGVSRGPEGLKLSVSLRCAGREQNSAETLPADAPRSELERRMAVALWKMLSRETGVRPAWGILTGVRPIKLFGSRAGELGDAGAEKWFREKLLVSPEKAALARATWENQKGLIALSRQDAFSLYLSVPFCPTRCAYCSFVSSSVEKAARLVPEYVELLCDEIRRTGELARSLHLSLQTVYIGGGTPTVLTAEQLTEVIGAVRSSFDLSACREFTAEAGRPDTVTPEKLGALLRGGVTRISINPQTLSDEVLREIGRRHTSEQTLSAFRLAREMGFSNINMDLIAGLPKDTPEGFRRTLEGVCALSPECVTVHTLALKRSARLNQELQEAHGAAPKANFAGEMIALADESLPAAGYRPYYLYRQSRMAGNLENTGWAKPGFEGIYNVLIMEECQTILACGAGAVTKLRDLSSDRIERIFNFKYPYEYIGRYEEMMNRKDRVKSFYESVVCRNAQP